MRTFTKNDISALTMAFQTFMGFANGQETKFENLKPLILEALTLGLTIDEILNMANYRRAAANQPGANAREYLQAMTERQIAVNDLKDEPDWDDPISFPLLAQIFHDFYIMITPKGGAWSTMEAKINLKKAIQASSLQDIMSEKAINNAATSSGLGDEMTCQQYLQEIATTPPVDGRLSESQNERRKIEKETLSFAEDQDLSEMTELNTEGIPEKDDTSIFFEDIIEKENYEDYEESDFGPLSYVSILNPREYKRLQVADAIMQLSVKEIFSLTSVKEESVTLDEMVTMLANGQFDRDKESLEAREVHQYINGMLFPKYLECVRMQGITISEETAAQLDLLTENWDLRDSNTRKLQKIKELVYVNAVDDVDLINVIRDLEKLYQNEKN